MAEYDQTTEEQQAEAQRQAWLRNVRQVMKRQEGKELIYTLLERCQAFKQTYRPGDFDGTAFMEGRRSIGLQLLSEVLEAAPESYMQILLTMKERTDEDR